MYVQHLRQTEGCGAEELLLLDLLGFRGRWEGPQFKIIKAINRKQKEI